MRFYGKIGYHVAALVIVAIWGSTFVCTKSLLAAGLVPSEIFVLRFVLAYTGLLVYDLLHKGFRLFASTWKDEGLCLIVGLTGGSLYFLTENTALEYEMASTVSFIVCTTPLLTSLLAIMLKRSVGMTRHLWAGTAMAFVGMAIVLFNGQTGLQLSLKGDFFAIGAACCWAVYSNVMDDLLQRYGAVFLTRKVFFYGLLTILPYFLITPWNFPAAGLWTSTVLFNILFLGLVASLGCFVAWNPVIHGLGVVTSSNYIYLNPVFTFISASLFLGERLTHLGAVGSLIILFGVFFASRPDRKK